jgi:amidohydrolase
MKDEDGALLKRQPSERSVELIAVMNRDNAVLGGRVHGGQEADVRRPAPATPRLGIALVRQDPMQPGLETVAVAQRPELAPRSNERGLYGVFGEIEVAQDPNGDGHAAVTDLAGQGVERRLIAMFRQLHERSLQLMPQIRMVTESQGNDARTGPKGSISGTLGDTSRMTDVSAATAEVAATDELKEIARERVERAHEALIGLSHWIQANPELNFHETLAAGWLIEWLEKAGFDVQKNVAGLDTAFVGTYGPGPLNVGIIAEYDALPEVGHACGHNVIAASAIGAGIALAAVADQLGIKVSVIGTPAEEGGGGKIMMVDQGVFDAVHCALMIHPGPSDLLLPEVLAAQTLEVTYTGKPAHAGSFPERGINAADAIVVAQVAIGLLRQSLTQGDRVHGIVKSGGEASNIIPAKVTAEWMVRATTVARLDDLREKVRRCFEAGALASGAELEMIERPVYADMRHDSALTGLYQRNLEALGHNFEGKPGDPKRLDMNRFSTDMGNVSYVTPSIHPILGIDSAPAVNHQPEFTAATVSAAADQQIYDGAVAMAWTAIDAGTDPELRQRLLDRREV